MGKKQEVLDELLSSCLKSGNMIFDNELVRDICKQVGFRNQFDVTKADNRKVMSPLMKERDFFLIHLGKGRHRFVPGIDRGFHAFERVPKDAALSWQYRPSVLNESNTSESNILSVAANQGVLQHFLYGDNPDGANIYCAHRTKITAAYTIDGEPVETEGMQVEIDMTCEKDGRVTVIEGKNGLPREFAAYQIFSPYLYYLRMREQNTAVREVDCCYILRSTAKDGDSILRMYLYAFDGAEMTSIRFIKCAEYRMDRR